MRILLDTNLLVRANAPRDSRQPVAIAAMQELTAGGHELCIVPQNLYEFWAVATRPVVHHGLGLSTGETLRECERFRQAFTLLDDVSAVLDRWLVVVVNHACQGKPSHDARLVAAMDIHGIEHLLTFNPSDFKRYDWLHVHEPALLDVSLLGRRGLLQRQPEIEP